MTSIDQQTLNTEQAAQQAVEQEIDIQARIRDITLQALTQGKLDKDGIKSVISAVTKGVISGSASNRDKLGSHFSEALNGMDDALASTAQAAKLASEEAISRISEFGQHEFNDTLKQMEALEDMFLETVNVAADQAGKLVSDSVRDLTGHLKNSGSAVGAQSREAADMLRTQLAQIGKQGITTAIDTGKQLGNQITQIASGILAGMADALNKK